MSQADRDYIQKLKTEEPFRGLEVKVSDAETYRFQILGRGEMAFYQQNERALLFELNAGFGVILKKSIKRWDNGQRVTDAERDVIVERAASYLTSKGAPQITVK